MYWFDPPLHDIAGAAALLWPRIRGGCNPWQRWVQSGGKVSFIRIAKTDVTSSMCIRTRTRGRGLETSTKAMHFWKSDFTFAFGRNKKR